MVTVGNWPVGVCTWSLQLEIEEVVQALDDLGVRHVHLAVGPAVETGGDEYLDVVRQQDWIITSTMIDFPQEDYSTLESIKRTGGIVPDQHWKSNRQRFFDAVDVTAGLDVEYLSMHAGFLESTEPAYAKKVKERIQELADAAADQGITLLLETGQETAEEMREFLDDLDHPALGVNFDPANMILYGKGNPIDAVHTVGSCIQHVHIKDAAYTVKPGTWGTEVPWGYGEVNSDSFLTALEEIGYDGALAIEREAGDDRLGDIREAIKSLT
ncbi:MAG TPA: sugar phosphate isomerase/epimerase family protein [bacterium]|nr:sugar phosphate isomerase/epimerase family protein [bacterium]